MAYEGSPADYEAPVIDEVGQIILKARELLSDPKRWCKDEYISCGERISYCTIGAIKTVSGQINVFASCNPTAEAARDRVECFLPDQFNSVHEYNDHPDTTHADVLALLDRAAKGGQP